MSAALIIVLVVALVIVAAGAYFFSTGKGAGRGRLRRRFGPEYDRVLARYGGDTKAAERELDARVTRYGALREEPLPAEMRERYEVRWAEAQERFVDSPGQAVAQADKLLAGLAQARGFPAAEQREEHFDALSVHHARHMAGYRMLHGAARDETTTETMREAMLRARGLFDALTEDRPRHKRHGAERHPAHTRWTVGRRQAKGSAAR